MINIINKYSYNKDKDNILTKHFKVGEFKSYNDDQKVLTTDEILIDDNLVNSLESIYNRLDTKYNLKYIIITSGYRSSDFEYYLSKSYTSYHVKGMAADIMCYKKDGSIIPSSKVCLVAEDLGINGIGYGGNYTHIDTRGYKSYFDEVKGKSAINSWYEYFNIRKNISYYPKTSYTGFSIVDGLKSVNIDSSYTNRTKIAIKNGISNYKGTASENTKLLSLLKQGLLIK